MSDPDDEVPEAPVPLSLPRAVVALALGPLLRLGLSVAALLAIATGAERIHAGAGYLVAGLLVWLEIARAGRRGRGDEQP